MTPARLLLRLSDPSAIRRCRRCGVGPQLSIITASKGRRDRPGAGGVVITVTVAPGGGEIGATRQSAIATLSRYAAGGEPATAPSVASTADVIGHSGRLL